MLIYLRVYLLIWPADFLGIHLAVFPAGGASICPLKRGPLELVSWWGLPTYLPCWEGVCTIKGLSVWLGVHLAS